MKKRLINTFFLFIMTCLVLFPFGFLITTLPGTAEKSPLENRTLVTFPSIIPDFQKFRTATKRIIQGRFDESWDIFYKSFFKGFYSRTFNTGIEKAASDQFPSRIRLIQMAKSLQLKQIEFSYWISGDLAMPAGINSDRMVMRSDPIFFYQPATFTQIAKQNINRKIENLEEIMQAHPQINYYIYYIDSIHYSSFHPATEYFPLADNRQGFEYFLENKPERLVVIQSKLNSFDDYRQFFFVTDHHWNAKGSWAAYESLYPVLKEHFPDISPKLVNKGFVTLPDVKFCGSHTIATLVKCYPDSFFFPDVELQRYSTTINGRPQLYGNMEKMIAGELPKSTYGIYGEFWGRDYATVGFQFENTSTRNLMIIGDSFTNSISRYVAAHYHNTYDIDLRQLKDYSFSELIVQYDISDVIIFATPNVLFLPKWLLNP